MFKTFGVGITSSVPLPVNVSDAMDHHYTLSPVALVPHLLAGPEWTRTHFNGFASVWRSDSGDRWVECRHEPSGQVFQFHCPPGSTAITVRWNEQTHPHNAAMTFVSSFLAGLLWEDGATCLHGAALDVAGRGALILGESGTGKSTLTLALLRLGVRLVSDDIAPLRPEWGAWVPSGPTYLRLWSDTARDQGLDPDSLPLVFTPQPPGRTKHYLDLRGDPRFQPDGTTLRAIFVLGERTTGPEPAVRRLPEAQAVAQLLMHRYDRVPLSEGPRTQALPVCVFLARTVPVYAVQMPAGLAFVPDAARTLAELVGRHNETDARSGNLPVR